MAAERRRTDSWPPGNGHRRDAALVLAGLAAAAQIPTTIALVPDPAIRAVLQLGVVVVTFVLGAYWRRR